MTDRSKAIKYPGEPIGLGPVDAWKHYLTGFDGLYYRGLRVLVCTAQEEAKLVAKHLIPGAELLFSSAAFGSDIWLIGWTTAAFFIKNSEKHAVNQAGETVLGLDLTYLEDPDDLSNVYEKGAYAGTPLGNLLATTPGAMFNPDEEVTF